MSVLLYLYDPLCGWCYGATAGLDALERETPRWPLRPLPTGLFAGDPQRRLDPAMEAHIWQSDQRIARVSGMPFSEAYREQVLRNPAMHFDSGPATRALSAVVQHAPTRERAALKAIQHARWVDGLDISDPEVLSAALAAAAGEPPETWPARLAHPALAQTTQQRLQHAGLLMRRFGFQGVPSLVALRDAPVDADEAALVELALRAGQALPGNALFDGSLPRALAALSAPAAP